MGKRNRSFMILGGLAAASALAGTASAFWNFFGEAPAAEEAQSGQSVKAEFNDASVNEVFKWLRSQGVEFVVETTDIQDRRITMNVTAKNKDALLKAIADALGFSVTKKDNTYVLKKASPFGSMDWDGGLPFSYNKDGKPMTEQERKAFEKEFGDRFKVLDGDSFKIFGDGEDFKFFHNGKPMTEKERKEFEKKFGDGFKVFDGKGIFGDSEGFGLFGLDGKPMTKEEQQKFEKRMKEFGESFKVFGDGEDFKFFHDGKPMTEKERKEFEKKFGKDFKIFDGEGFMKDFGKNFIFDFKTLVPGIEKELKEALKKGTVTENGKERPMTKEEKAKLEKELKELSETFKNLPEFKMHGMSPEDQKKFEAEMKKFGENMKDFPKFEGHMKHFGDGERLTINGSTIKELKASLSDSQKELMKKQGYLKWADLNEAQRKMIGMTKSEGDFSVTLSDDNGTITIKSK